MPNDSLVILQGKDGTKYPIGTQGLTLGRDSSNDVVIADDQVAAKHARILVSNGRFFVRDERGSGGTFINGERIAGQREFHPGDILQLGSTVFKFSAVKSTKPAPAPDAQAPPPSPIYAASKTQRKNIVFAGLAFIAAVLILLIMIIQLGLGGLSFPTPTQTSTPTSSPTPETKPVIIETEPPAVETPTPSMTPTPEYNAKLSCVESESQFNIYLCTVTNLSDSTDAMRLSFTPSLAEELNGFEISIKIQDQDTLLIPNPDDGRVNLGEVGPKLELKFDIIMACNQPSTGCPETKITVSVLVNNGQDEFTGPDGEFVMFPFQDAATPTPKKAATNTPEPTEKPSKPPDEGP